MDLATLQKVGNFDQPTINQLAGDTGSLVESISAAGALSPLGVFVTELSVDGTKAYTLAAPTFANQRKLIRCVAATNTPLGTLTISSPDTTTGFVCATTFTFDTVGQEIELQATAGLKWRCVRVKRAGTSGNNGVVIGTTVLTGKNLWSVYMCSVTGTVSSTTTKALPDGSAVGETITIATTTAASIPSGTLGGTYVDATATARTGFVIDNAADQCIFAWNGSAWQAVFNSGGTFS